jgi:hypothetical protein
LWTTVEFIRTTEATSVVYLQITPLSCPRHTPCPPDGTPGHPPLTWSIKISGRYSCTAVFSMSFGTGLEPQYRCYLSINIYLGYSVCGHFRGTRRGIRSVIWKPVCYAHLPSLSHNSPHLDTLTRTLFRHYICLLNPPNPFILRVLSNDLLSLARSIRLLILSLTLYLSVASLAFQID